MSAFFASEFRPAYRLVLFASLVALFVFPAGAQSRDDELVDINFSGTVKVTTLLDLMSKQLGIRFLHGADVARREVTVYTPAKLPRKVFPTLLGSLLREANLAVVDSEVEGWKRIVDVGDLVSSAPTGLAEEVSKRNGPAGAVTQVLRVKYIDLTTASTALKPFLGKQGPSSGSNLVSIANQGVLIVTGYAPDVQQIAELLEMIDRPDEKGVIEFYETRRRPPSMLIKQYESVTQSDDTKKPARASGPKLLVDRTGRRVVVAGAAELVRSTIDLLERLDSGSNYLTRVYRLEFISAGRLDNLIEGFVERDREDRDSREIETTVDQDGNLLVVRAGAQVHQQIEKLIEELDQPVDSEESPIRFYKLKNATALEVLYSLLALQQAAGINVEQAGGLGQGAFGTLGGANVGGVFGMGAQQNQVIGLPLGGQVNQTGAQMGLGQNGIGRQGLSGNLSTSRVANQNAALGGLLGGNAGIGATPAQGGGALGGGLAGGGSSVATLPGGARVSADVATNSLIVFAPSNVQSLYEKLIRSLDQRRPQVLIEADIIAIDTSNNFSLGVEVSIGDREGSRRLFKFTSFGLSEVDAATGALTVNPSLGFNGVLVDPEVADVIVQALSRHTRGRVLSSPKLLVNDNQTGILESVSSIPFQSVNAADTIATTSLGGNQQAGTTIQVTPHINEDDHLQLEFDLEFSTFVGTGTANLPPPRQIDRVGSVVTIPDGRTVVVGGLKRTSEGDTFTGVPWLEKIPVLRELSSMQTSEETTMSFFLFIRPRILRDSRFRDLQFLSDLETEDALLQGDYPKSGPLLVPCATPPTPTRELRPMVQ